MLTKRSCEAALNATTLNMAIASSTGITTVQPTRHNRPGLMSVASSIQNGAKISAITGMKTTEPKLDKCGDAKSVAIGGVAIDAHTKDALDAKS